MTKHQPNKRAANLPGLVEGDDGFTFGTWHILIHSRIFARHALAMTTGHWRRFA